MCLFVYDCALFVFRMNKFNNNRTNPLMAYWSNVNMAIALTSISNTTFNVANKNEQTQRWEAFDSAQQPASLTLEIQLSENMSVITSQNSSLSTSCVSVSVMTTTHQEARAIVFNSCSEIPFPMNESQGPIRYNIRDCYNTDRHGNIINDMSMYLSRSHTKKGVPSEAMLNKDIRRHCRGVQGSSEPRPISESPLAREPAKLSDRAEELHRSNEIALSPCSPFIFPSSASQPSLSAPLSLSPSLSFPFPISFSSSPLLKEKVPPLSTSYPSLFSTCHTIHTNMPLAAISHACSQSSNAKHPKSSLQHPPSPSVLASSLQTVRYASEQGKLFAQRSYSSLNRLLDSVMDNATTLTESGPRQMYHHSSGDSHISPANSPSTKGSKASTITSTSTVLKRPPLARNHSSKATFFVCEDDSENEEDEDDEEDEPEHEDQRPKAPHFIKVRSSMEFIDYCRGDFQAFEQLGDNEDIDQEDYFRKATLFKHDQTSIHTSVSGPLSDAPGMGRRQSLLSDLFMTEKLLAAQRASSCKAVNNNTTIWTRPLLYPDPPLSRHSTISPEGDDLFSAVIDPQQIIRSTQLKTQPTCQTLVGLTHQSIQSSHHQHQHFDDRIPLQEELASPKVMAGHEMTLKSPLKRTKKSMFKNLDELAVDTTADGQEADATEHFVVQGQQPDLTPANLAAATAPTYEIPDCKTAFVTISPAFIPAPASPSPSPPKSSEKLSPHSTSKSPAKACRCSPATATTKTAFATVSATSKCTATTSPVFSAVTAAAAIAANTGIGGDNFSSWTQVYHFQAHIQSFYEHLSSSIQKAISTSSET